MIRSLATTTHHDVVAIRPNTGAVVTTRVATTVAATVHPAATAIQMGLITTIGASVKEGVTASWIDAITGTGTTGTGIAVIAIGEVTISMWTGVIGVVKGTEAAEDAVGTSTRVPTRLTRADPAPPTTIRHVATVVEMSDVAGSIDRDADHTMEVQVALLLVVQVSRRLHNERN